MTMPAFKIPGSFVYPVANGGRSASLVDEMTAAIQTLERKKQEWAEKRMEQRLGFLETMIQDFTSLAPEWVEKVCNSGPDRIRTRDAIHQNYERWYCKNIFGSPVLNGKSRKDVLPSE